MKNSIIEKIEEHLQKTYRNKLAALVLIGMGLFITRMENDATVLVFGFMFGIPMFLSKEDVFGD